jgi:hypothetical protein
MTKEEFNAALDQLDMRVSDFALVSTVREDRIERWRRGEEDIPGFVPALCGLLTLPGAVAMATRIAHHYREDRRS